MPRARRTRPIALAGDSLISTSDVATAREQGEATTTQLRVEQQRLQVMTESMKDQIASADSQVARMRSIVQFQRHRLASMRVQAGAQGVLQDLPLEEGQWVTPGATLAKVVQPGRLKAVLRIPEYQAKDVALGQKALIDTAQRYRRRAT